jgi:hypothetical protein
MTKAFIFLLMLLTATGAVWANNVQLTNVSIINNGPGNIQVKFDLSWDNSWRTNVGQNNYDGVWVFFKYKNPAVGTWAHMTMTGSNNVVPVGVDVYQTNDFLKIGAMIYRESTNMGTGTTTLTDIKLGVISTLPYNIDLRGFAVEMVFVPAPTTRPFFGDGNGTTESTNALHYTNNTATNSSVVPMLADNNSYDDAEIDVDGIYVYSNDTIQKSNPIGSLDPFPTMKALWCMKYEIDQAQYRDFLNTLTYTQQAARTANAPNSSVGTGAFGTAGADRQFIEVATVGVASTTPAVYGCDGNANNTYNEAGDGEWIPCGNLMWPDVAAYLDWSGLAPMSELQFERITRGHSSAGSQPAVLGEYAWGTATIFGSTYTLSGASTTSELTTNASTTLGNAAYSTTSSSPFRAGIFATGVSTRITSGAAFFGPMEMSGSLDEYVVSIGTAAGRSVRFIPNGSGSISAAGNAQLSVGGAGFWPGMEGNNSTSTVNTCSGTCEVTGTAGIVLKGGSFNSGASTLPISLRNYFNPALTRPSFRGGRGILYIR